MNDLGLRVGDHCRRITRTALRVWPNRAVAHAHSCLRVVRGRHCGAYGPRAACREIIDLGVAERAPPERRRYERGAQVLPFAGGRRVAREQVHLAHKVARKLDVDVLPLTARQWEVAGVAGACAGGHIVLDDAANTGAPLGVQRRNLCNPGTAQSAARVDEVLPIVGVVLLTVR